MNSQVELKTSRLYLRKYKIEDAPLLHEKLGLDERMFKYSGWNPYISLESTIETIKMYTASNDGNYAWIVEDNGVVVGTIGAYDFDNETSEIEVGMSIFPEFWNRGYSSEALKAVFEFLTQNAGIKRIKAWCASENIASRRSLEKAGMRVLNIEKDGLEVGDRHYDKVSLCYDKE